MMYKDTITLFNAYDDGTGLKYYPTVINNTDFHTVQSEEDNCNLHISFNRIDDDIYVGSKQYKKPKSYASSDKSETITFQEKDIIYFGTYEENVITDSSYANGFYEYLNSTVDDVYLITKCNIYNMIPHFEIGGK